MAKQDVSSRTSASPKVFPELTVTPQLSICIVNWNCCAYLHSLLASIRAACETLAVEVIVVDNASSDNSAAMVSEEFPEVKLIRNLRHEGIAKANNGAAARARGELLLFLNNDTCLRSGGLTGLVNFLDQHPEVSAVGPRIIFPNGKPQGCVRNALGFRALLHRVWFLRWTRLFRSADREYRHAGFDLTRSGYVEQIVGPALLVRRQQFMEVGGWDEAFEFHMDDVDLSSRLNRLGKMYYLAETEVVHWGGVASALDPNYAYRFIERSCVHYVRKHFGPRAARSYKILITLDMPVRILVLALSWFVKRGFATRDRAARSYAKLVAASRFFLHELPAYWAS